MGAGELVEGLLSGGVEGVGGGLVGGERGGFVSGGSVVGWV